MFYFNKQFENGNGGRNHKAQYAHVQERRRAANAIEHVHAQIRGNAAAIIPQDVYREFDNQTAKLLRADNLALFSDLMPLAKALPIGKVEHIYRRASDAGVVTSSLTGQTPAELDKTAFDYDSSIKVIHQSGYGRSWMEMEGQRSEAFDGLIDDNENTVRAVINKIVDHLYNGVDVSFKGTDAYGIKTSSKTEAVDLGPGGLNIDFTSKSASATDIRTGWLGMVYALRRDNNVNQDITFYISSEIEENLQRIYDSSGGMADKTIMAALKDLAGVADIKTDRELSGNEVVGVVLSNQFIRPLVGMAVTTVPLSRQNPFDNYNFLVWSNVGLEIKTDYSGNTGVLYASELTS